MNIELDGSICLDMYKTDPSPANLVDLPLYDAPESPPILNLTTLRTDSDVCILVCYFVSMKYRFLL